jgi:hypothetical protein
MKQFLVLLAILPLILLFFLQFASDQINNSRMAIVNDYVYTAKEEAKQAGGFTPQIKGKLKTRLAEALNISADSITIASNATGEGQIQRMTKACASDSEWRTHLIHYVVTVPIGSIMAGGELMGIKAEDNVYNYTIEAYTASEYLP